MSRKTIIAGNWKMNGTLATNAILIDSIVAAIGDIATDVIVCPPSPYLNQVSSLVAATDIRVGAQNINLNQSGAFTGEMSALMAKDCGASCVIVGHSERRSLYGESSEIVADKTVVALDNGLTPIVCIGEELSARESGKTNVVLALQMQALFDKIVIEDFANIIIAYEPVWAIGTGVTATPTQAQETQSFVRGLIAVIDKSIADNISILYGGSMNPKNAKELIACPDIDGGLIGGAALNAQDFLTICRAV